MGIGFTVFVISVIILFIWIIVEFKRMRHKFFAFFLIALILFTYLSFSIVLKGKNIQLNSVSGLIDAGKLYFNWLISVFGNVKIVTGNIIKMDWNGNSTASK